jgi:hypothetical protein
MPAAHVAAGHAFDFFLAPENRFFKTGVDFVGVGQTESRQRRSE